MFFVICILIFYFFGDLVFVFFIFENVINFNKFKMGYKILKRGDWVKSYGVVIVMRIRISDEEFVSGIYFYEKVRFFNRVLLVKSLGI